MSGTNKVTGPADIMQIFGGVQATGVLTAGIKLGLFGAIDRGASDVDAVARATECPARTTRILLDATVAIGLVEKKGTTYSLTAAARDHLVPGKPQYLGDVANIFSNPMLWHEFGRLDAVARHDGTLLESHAETEKNPFWETFAQSSAALAMPTGQQLAELLGEHLAKKPKARVLDVAAGSGIHGYSLAKAVPTVELTQIDWPNVLEKSKVWQDRMGVEAARVSRIPGSFFEVDWKGPYDVVTLCNVYHHFDDPTCLTITKKAAAALAPGGKLVVEEFLYDAEIANPMGAMFAVIMMAWSRKGQTYSAGDITRWAKESGLGASHVEPNRAGPSSLMIIDKA
jgi:2-polyprenyl-3-methyl-5-hydroxy-6-metoxy-1,4-benzoquinol methylase